MRPTFHLVPEAVWAGSDPRVAYEAASLAVEGFIHCTDGVEALGATFDRHYAADPRPFVALTVDLDAIDVPWRYRRPGLAVPAHLRADRPCGDPGGQPASSATPDGRFTGLTPV